MKKRNLAILILLILCFLIGCQSVPEKSSLNVAVVTDLHYAGAENHKYQGTYLEINDTNGSGKQMRYLDDITDAFFEEMNEQKPDYLLVAGDITFIGAKESHEAIAKKFSTLAENGITVLVIPGNHDITGSSFLFPEGEAVETSSVTPEEFAEIYRPFGYEGGLSYDENSLSYVYDTGKGIRFFMLDTNMSYGSSYGKISPQTLRWIESQLLLCQEAGDTPIAVGHHNLLTHNEMFILGYRIGNSSALVSLFEKYGVTLYLSGHMHAQHIAQNEAVTDIAGGSFAVYPHHYGIITLDKDKWNYEAKETNVETYAKNHTLTDESLLNYSDYGFDFFYRNAYNQAKESLSHTVSDSELLDKLCDFSAKANVYYFGGTPSLLERSLQEDFIHLSEGTRWGSYVYRILQDQTDSLSCSYPVLTKSTVD